MPLTTHPESHVNKASGSEFLPTLFFMLHGTFFWTNHVWSFQLVGNLTSFEKYSMGPVETVHWGKESIDNLLTQEKSANQTRRELGCSCEFFFWPFSREGPHITRAYLQLPTKPMVTLNFWSFCLWPSTTGIQVCAVMASFISGWARTLLTVSHPQPFLVI